MVKAAASCFSQAGPYSTAIIALNKDPDLVNKMSGHRVVPSPSHYVPPDNLYDSANQSSPPKVRFEEKTIVCHSPASSGSDFCSAKSFFNLLFSLIVILLFVVMLIYILQYSFA